MAFSIPKYEGNVGNVGSHGMSLNIGSQVLGVVVDGHWEDWDTPNIFTHTLWMSRWKLGSKVSDINIPDIPIYPIYK